MDHFFQNNIMAKTVRQLIPVWLTGSLVIGFGLCGPLHAAGPENTLTLTTTYPSRHGTFSRLLLVPQNTAPGSSCDTGMLFFNANGKFSSCESFGAVGTGSGTWLPAIVWRKQGTYVYLVSDVASGATPFLGIGTTNPQFRLTILGDGGILAKGTLGTGNVLAVGGEGTRLIWYPLKAAFRAGYVDDEQWDDGNIGTFSFAAGTNTLASGHASAAWGADTQAISNNTTALGFATVAQGQASVAMGEETETTAEACLVMGYRTRATARLSTAWGKETLAKGDGSTVFGLRSWTEDLPAANFSTAMGEGSVAAAFYATAIGFNSQAVGLSSTAIGAFARAQGDYSTSIGNNTEATGDHSVALGRGVTATGENSTVIGTGMTAFGTNAFSIGYNAFANGDESFAVGRFVRNENFGSFVFGRYNIVSFDRHNWVWTDPLFVLGNGTDHLTRSNAVTVLKNGNFGIQTDDPTSRLHIMGVQEYADNAAAMAAGLSEGAFYRTGDELKIVH
jgi:hypothetical protein